MNILNLRIKRCRYRIPVYTLLTITLLIAAYLANAQDSANKINDVSKSTRHIIITDETALELRNNTNADPVNKSNPGYKLNGSVAGNNSSTDSEVQSLLRLADKYTKNNQLLDADTLYRRILLELDPYNEQAYTHLIDIHKSYDLPKDHPQADQLQKELGNQFKRYQTPHFIILSDANSLWTRNHASRLERAYHQFFRVADNLELKPLPLRTRLICIVMNDHDDFIAYASKKDNMNAAWIAGYYSSLPNYVVFYNTFTGPAMSDALNHLQLINDDLNQNVLDLREAQRNRKYELSKILQDRVDNIKKYLKNENQRLTNIATDAVAIKTIHEATHLLAFNTGIQTRKRQYPFWITEGLATCMETSATQAAFGPEYENDDRRLRFNELLTQNNLLPLAKFICITSVNNNSDTMADILYHQSYALFKWLYAHKKKQLAQYFEILALPNNTLNEQYKYELDPYPDAETYRKIFIQCFGNIDEIEKDWLDWENQHNY